MSVMANDALTLSAATSAITEKFEKLISEERAVTARHVQALSEANERVSTLEAELPVAVQEAKKRVYDKAQAQFAAGNKEFQKVKNTLRDAVTAKEEGDKKVAALEVSLQNALTQVTQVEAEKAALCAEMASVSNRLELIVKGDVGVLAGKTLSAIDTVAAVLSYYRDKNGEYTQLLSKAQDDKSKHEAAVRDMSSQLATAQATVKELQQAVESAESRLACATEALTISKRENQNQLLLTANVMSEKGRMEAALSSATTELQTTLQKHTDLKSALTQANEKVAELTTRCDELRAMNKEVIEMLEAMYAKEG